MEPLACNLDHLQGDKDCFLGVLMPKLIQLRLKMTRMLNDNLHYCRPLVSALLNAISLRFKSYLDFDLSNAGVREAVLASVSHLIYKLKWVPPKLHEEVTKCLFETLIGMNSAPADQDQPLEIVLDNEDYGYYEDQCDLQKVTLNRANSIRTNMN